MKKLNSTGETIVEVLLSIVILGFTIVVVFSLARNSLSTGQAAGERTQALTIVQSQIERLKLLSTSPNSKSPSGIFGQGTKEFCINTNNAVVSDFKDCDTAGFPDQEIKISIVYDADGPDEGGVTIYDDNTFTISAEWNRVGGGLQKEKIVNVYRLHPEVAIEQASVTCDSSDIDLSEYVLKYIKDADLQRGALDVAYIRDKDDPSKEADKTKGDPAYYKSSALKLSPKSHPDIALELTTTPLLLNPACDYTVDWEVYCTPAKNKDGDFVIGEPPAKYSDCLTKSNVDQTNEAAVIEMYESYTGNDNDVRCDGQKLASFTTSDKSEDEGGSIIWGEIGTSVNVSYPSFPNPATVKCVQIVHVCTIDPASCSTMPTDASSVYFDKIVFKGIPKL